MSAQTDLARTFAARHRAGPLLFLPNVWDALSARLFADAGFGALATTSCGVAWALGYPDGERAPWGEVVAATARIVRAAGVAVTADIEAGYGATPDDVGAHVADIVRAGAVGVNIEDSLAGGLRPMEEAAARIAAARAAADAAGVPIFINARVDVWVRGSADPLQEGIARAKAYLAAGADGIYPFGLHDAAVIADFVKAVSAPVNILGGHGAPAVAELARLGVRRVTLGGAPTVAAAGAVQRMAAALYQQQDPAALPAGDAPGYPDLQRMFADRG